MFTIKILPFTLAVCRLEKNSAIPEWILKSNGFFSITRTDEELSIVCLEADVPSTITHEKSWRICKVVGPLDFSLTGVLSSIVQPLAGNSISIFSISTYDTDYILVKEDNFDRAISILRKSFEII